MMLANATYKQISYVNHSNDIVFVAIAVRIAREISLCNDREIFLHSFYQHKDIPYLCAVS